MSKADAKVMPQVLVTGGVGLRRGRRDPGDILAGDALLFGGLRRSKKNGCLCSSPK